MEKKPSAFGRVRDRLAALQDRDAPTVVPGGPGSPAQQDAMRETLQILSDPAMLRAVQAGRRAVATGDVVAVEPAPPGAFRVVLAGTVARALEGDALHQVFDALAAAPAEQGRALGMGLTGVWSAHGGSQRVLYAVHSEQRLVTVLTVDEPGRA